LCRDKQHRGSHSGARALLDRYPILIWKYLPAGLLQSRKPVLDDLLVLVEHAEKFNRSGDDIPHGPSRLAVVQLSCNGTKGIMSKRRVLLDSSGEGRSLLAWVGRFRACTLLLTLPGRSHFCVIIERNNTQKSKLVDSKTHSGAEELRQRDFVLKYD
jgi:hypothetical protein